MKSPQKTVEQLTRSFREHTEALRRDLILSHWEPDAARQMLRKAIVGLL